MAYILRAERNHAKSFGENIDMTAKSMSIRKVEQFQIPDDKYEIMAAGNGVNIGYIQKLENTINVEGHTLKIFNASFQETIKEQITVFDSDIDDYIAYSQVSNRT